MLQHKPHHTLPLGHTVEGNRLVTLTGIDFERHKHIIGISGSEKSSFLATIALLLLRQGVPFTLIDPHADLSTLILSLLASSDFYTNPRAYEKLWYVDFSRSDCAIAFNVLNQPYEPHTIANNVLEATHRAFPVSGTTASLDNVLLAATLALAENGKSLTALHNLLIDSRFREALLNNVSDPLVVQFFKSKLSENINSQLVDSTLRRSFLLTFSPTLRNTLGQKENKLNFRALMDNKISCIFNLGGLDDSTKRFLGSLLMIGLEQAFLSRASLPAQKRTPYHVIVDEFPLFCASEDSFSVVMEQCRKYGGCLYLSHQTISQLPKGITGSLQNAISILFKLGYEDSTWAAQRFVRNEDVQEEHFLDTLLGAPGNQPGVFSQVKNLQEAKHIFETQERQEAILTINKQALHIRTHTVPFVTVNPRKLAEIEAIYARHLLTPLATIQRELTASNIVVVSSAPASTLPLAKRRVGVSMTLDRQPFQLLTGELSTDILALLYHFHYATLPQVAKLLQRATSENYIRTKLQGLITDGLLDSTTLARSSSGKPPTVYYLTVSGMKKVINALELPHTHPTGAKKHGYLEHTLACNEVLIASVALPQVEPSITLYDLKHERTLKNAAMKVADGTYLVPDGWAHFGMKNEAIGICYEIDRNTEEREKIVSKLKNYVQFASGIYQQIFGLSSLTIAFCVTEGGERRVKQLVSWAEQALGSAKDAAPLFLFGSVTPGAIKPTIFFFDSFFISPFDTTTHALIETLP